MDLVSFQFLLFALLAIISLRLVRTLTLRPILVLALNGIFLASFLERPADAMPVATMLALGYVSLCAVSLKPSRLLLGLVIAAIVLLFVWLKRYTVLMEVLPADLPALQVVGLSYILFRILHLVIDVSQGTQRLPSIIRYLNYCLFFPTFLSGPIARYEQIDAQMRLPTAPFSVPMLQAAFSRILLGLFMVVVVSAYAATAVDFIKTTNSILMPDHAAWLKTAKLFSLISFFVFVKLFANFAGSMHVLLGLGSLCGFTLPENFNKPYLAKNFLDFWARWHITLSEWIKFYLFNPLLAFLTRRFPAKGAATAIGAVAFFMSFFVIGMWHGSTLAFAIFGVMLGVGATMNKLWQQAMARTLGKKEYKTLTQRNWYFQLARGMTLAYIALALICLWMEPGYIAHHGARWVVTIMAISWVMLTVSFTIIGAIADMLFTHIPRGLPDQPSARYALMLLALFLVFNHLGAFGSGTPDLVYKGF